MEAIGAKIGNEEAIVLSVYSFNEHVLKTYFESSIRFVRC